MTDLKKLEDNCTEYTALFFKGLSPDAIYEPKNLTNGRLPDLANGLLIIGRQAGIQTHKATPHIKDIWREGSLSKGEKSTYTIEVTFPDLPMFEIPVLPRDAA